MNSFVVRLGMLLLLLMLCGSGALGQSPPSPPELAPPELAGQHFKNVSVLKDMPADQMGKVMNLMSAALGVQCNYCHDGFNFATEGIKHKDTARKMLTMTLELNQVQFHGQALVTCNTCHRGRATPQSELNWNHAVSNIQPNFQAEKNSSAKEVLDKYVRALGGRDRLNSIRSVHVDATRLEPNGKSEPEEFWTTSDGLARTVTIYGTTRVIEGFDGKSSWKKVDDRVIALKSDEAEQIQREAQIALGIPLHDALMDWQMGQPERVGDKAVRVLSAVSKSGFRERFYFDQESGLLVRRTATVETRLGPFDFQVEYLDYQSTDGFMMAREIRFAYPNVAWSRRTKSVEINVETPSPLFHP